MTDQMTDQEFNRSILGLPYHERMRLLEERQQAKQVAERGRNLTDSEMKRWDAFFRGHIEQRLGEQYEFSTGVLTLVVGDIRGQIEDAIDQLREELRAEIKTAMRDLRNVFEAMLAGTTNGLTDRVKANVMVEVDRRIDLMAEIDRK